MCTGAEALLAASLITTAAGTAYSVKSTKDVRKAKDAAALNELRNKEKVTKESQKLFNQTASESGAQDAAGEAERAAAEQVAATQADRQVSGFGPEAPSSAGGAAASENPIVKESAARSLADALQVADSQVKAKALLSGLGRQRQQRQQAVTRAGQQQDMMRNFMQGWGQVGQTGQAAAQTAGTNDAMLGDILTGIGQVGTTYAGSKMKAPSNTPAIPVDDYGAFMNAGPGMAPMAAPASAQLFPNQGAYR